MYRFAKCSCWFWVAACIALLSAVSLQASDNGLALTPPMGWNSWNKFRCNVSEDLIKSAADAMVSSGMKEAGYEYVVIDDCWQVSRDASGNIVSGAQISVTWEELGYPAHLSAAVRDLWMKKDLGKVTGTYGARVSSHEVVMIKVIP
jgi:hypothetical protein